MLACAGSTATFSLGSVSRLGPRFLRDSSYLSPMCNDYEQQIAWAEYCKMMQALELGVPTQQSETDLPQADHIKINDIGPVMRASGNGIQLAPMRFGFPPPKPRGAPVFNFRSEGRHFAKSTLPHPGLGVLRVHRQEIPEGNAPFYAV